MQLQGDGKAPTEEQGAVVDAPKDTPDAGELMQYMMLSGPL